ncbi:MAG: YjbQ family protein [Parcubacteria group bacterium]|nr:YjbQ family protein [Parcubacteria group bacterium]
MERTDVPRIRFKDITERIMGVVAKSEIENGIVVIQTRHTTTGLMVNENEVGLLKTDFPKMLARLCPDGEYAHDRPERLDAMDNEPVNGVSHLRAMFLRESIHLSVARGAVRLGEWQSIVFYDFDPEHREERSLEIFVLGDS